VARLFADDDQIANARFLESFEVVTRSGGKNGTVIACNPTGYDMLALNFRSFYIGGLEVKTISQPKCEAPKYRRSE